MKIIFIILNFKFRYAFMLIFEVDLKPISLHHKHRFLYILYMALFISAFIQSIGLKYE
jgi:hypothetical protein